MSDPHQLRQVVCALIFGLAFVAAMGVVAYVLFFADWFDAGGDFTDSQLQSRIDAAFKEES